MSSIFRINILSSFFTFESLLFRWSVPSSKFKFTALTMPDPPRFLPLQPFIFTSSQSSWYKLLIYKHHSNIKKSNPLLISRPHLADISLHAFVSPSQQERWRKFHKSQNISVTFLPCGLRSEIVTQLPCIKCSLHVAVYTVVPSGPLSQYKDRLSQV